MGTILRKIRTGVKNVVSDVKAIPAKIKQNKIDKQNRYDEAVMKEYEKVKDIPIEPANESNPVFRANVNANEVRYRRDPAYRAEIDKKKKEVGL